MVIAFDPTKDPTPLYEGYLAKPDFGTETNVVAIRALLGLSPQGNSPQKAKALEACVQSICTKPADETLFELSSTLTRFLQTLDPKTDTLSLYNHTISLMKALQKADNLKARRKLLTNVATALQHILYQYHAQKQNGERLVPKISEADKKALQDSLDSVKKRIKKETKDLTSSEDAARTDFYLNFIEEALKHLDTEKSKTDRNLEAFGRFIAGIVNIANRDFSAGFQNIKSGFESFEKKKEWGRLAIALHLFEVSRARKDPAQALELITLIDNSKNDKVHYQGILSLANLVRYGETPEIRAIGYNKLLTYRNPLITHLLAKIAKEAPTPEEKARALDQLHARSAAHKVAEDKLASQQRKHARFNSWNDLVQGDLQAKGYLEDTAYSSGSQSGSTASSLSSSPPPSHTDLEPHIRNTNVDKRLASKLDITEEQVQEFFPRTQGLIETHFSKGVKFTSEGVAALIERLKEHKDITALDLRDCFIPEASLPQLLQNLVFTGVTKVYFDVKLTEDAQGTPYANAILANRQSGKSTFELVFEHPCTYRTIAFCLKKDDLDVAESYINQAIVKGLQDPELVRFHLVRSIIRRQNCKFDGAIKDAEVLMKSLDPVYRGKGHLQMGFCFDDSSKNLSEAVKCYRNGLKEDPNNPVLQSSLAHAIYKGIDFTKEIDDPTYEVICEGYEYAKKSIKHPKQKPFYKEVLDKYEYIMKQFHPNE